MSLDPAQRCPCQSGEVYGQCCGPLHAGARHAATAVALMRSRFSAFAVGDADYVSATWDPATRPARLDLAPDVEWFRLDITDTTGGGPFDDTGEVAFIAHYRHGGARGRQTERSTFRRRNGRWYYLDAVPPGPVGR